MRINAFSTNHGGDAHKESRFGFGRVVSWMFTVSAAIFILCGLGIFMNLWITDNLSDHMYVKIAVDEDNSSEIIIKDEPRSLKMGHIQPKVEALWSKVKLYAVSNEKDFGVAFKAKNISVEEFDDKCQVPRLEDDKQPPFVTCKRPKPIKGSCQVANRTFHTVPTPTCAHQKTHVICKVKSTAKVDIVDCTNDICKTKISLGLINILKGALKWTLMPNITSLENAIQDVIRTDERHGNYGFCFLRCILEDATTAKQLLLLPKNVSQLACKNKNKNKKSCNAAININIIWLDSTSHSHFYRSMPKSVAAFRDIKASGAAYVFNYNLMQSMEGGTYVNTIAFTSGRISQRKILLRTRVPIGELFNLFKKEGYDVTWIDDLCWTWSMDHCACGIPKFLGIVNDKQKPSYTKCWKRIQESLGRKGVGQIGLSLANCEIMQANNITDPFKSSNKNVAICYNGEYQTNYLLSSMEMLQTQLKSVQRPFLHFLDLNLGHEASGRRIQTLDESLANFINYLSHQDNTFTLMFGDHGNKYGTFVKATKESKVEMAHTVLFAVASRNLKDKLGAKKIEALAINQDRLVNILDLRQTILTLAPGTKKKSLPVDKKFDVHPEGLFHPISPKRTCKSMGIKLEAGKCICQEGQVNDAIKNDTRVAVIADFALGKINNKIQEQSLAGNNSAGFRSCQRLVGKWISEVQETIVEKLTVTEMNIHVPAGDNILQTEDAFSVVIHVTRNTPSTTFMELVHYERITTYAVYDKCRDLDVDGDLCVCDVGVPDVNQTQVSKKWHEFPQIVFGRMTTVFSLNNCLFIHERRTPYGLVLGTSCDCTNGDFEVLVQVLKQSNVVTSKSLPMLVNVRSGMMLFLCAVHQLSPLQPWYLDYDVKFRQL